MAPNLRITLIAREDGLAGHPDIRLQSKGYQVITHTRLSSVLGFIYSDPPDIIIIDLFLQDEESRTIVSKLKSDNYFSTIPVIGLLSESVIDDFDWESCPLDDFVAIPLRYCELFSRIELSVQRIKRVFDHNPLTRLPGNTSIQKSIEKYMGKEMSVCYIDINNFKPYNDVYGFSRGDEVIRMLARIMFNAVKESGGGFAGHIGGDDFVFIVPNERAEEVSRTIIDNFTTIVEEIFDDEEKERGFYMARNRKGEVEKTPLLGIAIAIVPLDAPHIQHYGKVSEVAAELKKQAKKKGESCMVLDRRKGGG